jgi:hypothetical protein
MRFLVLVVECVMGDGEVWEESKIEAGVERSGKGERLVSRKVVALGGEASTPKGFSIYDRRMTKGVNCSSSCQAGASEEGSVRPFLGLATNTYSDDPRTRHQLDLEHA